MLDDTLENIWQLLDQSFISEITSFYGPFQDETDVPVWDPDVGDVGPGGVVASDPLPQVVGTEPAVLGIPGEAGLLHAVPGQLAHVAAGQLPDLGRDAVLLHQRFLGEVELERIVRGQGDVETSHQVVMQGWSETIFIDGLSSKFYLVYSRKRELFDRGDIAIPIWQR